MNSRERILRTLDHKEPDTVPMMELQVDPPLMEAITAETITGLATSTHLGLTERGGGGNLDVFVKCYKQLGLDMIPLDESPPESWKPQINPDTTFTNEWGTIFVYEPRAKYWTESSGGIKTVEDYQNLPIPDPHAPGRLSALDYVIRKVKGEMAVAGFVHTPLASAWDSFGALNFCLLLRKNPEFIRKVIERRTEYNIEIIKSMVDIGVDLIISRGDLAETNGPMVSPKYFKDIIFPNLKKEVDAAHRKGVKYIKHSDGNLNLILDDLANIVDGLQSIDPSAGMDIGVIKQEYGNKLILMGNITSIFTKRVEDVAEEVKECIRKAAPGGGYILTSSPSWSIGAKLENCLAMLEAGRKYGNYPIIPP